MSTENIYTKIKDIFINEDDVRDFVNLDKSMACYNNIVSALQKPLKLILFYGKPGTGKTFLLRKMMKDFEDRKDVIFFPHPFFSEQNFIETLCEKLSLDKNQNITNFETFIKEYSQKFKDKNEILQNQVVIILDEAQLYPPDLIEKIRILADTRLFKFLFTVHKTSDEDVLAKDYFTTRVWESIELQNANRSEITLYIQKKLALQDCEKFLRFTEADYAFIHNLCGGNLRTLNKMMYKYFEFCEYYEQHEPSALASESHTKRLLTMSALDAGLINA